MQRPLGHDAYPTPELPDRSGNVRYRGGADRLSFRGHDREGSTAPFRLTVANGPFPRSEAVSQSAPVNDN
jgi:hypothetical protein